MNSIHAALFSVDRWLLLKINRDWTAPSLDAIMPVFTNLQKVPWFIYGVGPAILALWLWRGRKHALKIIVVAGLAMGASDLVAYRVIKPWASRPRPEYTVSQVDVKAPTGGRYGFPSNHSANAAAAAAVLSVAYPGGAYAFAGLAFLVGYSRIYVGAHFPFDVIFGWLLGYAIGWPWGVLMLGGGGGGSSSKKKRR